MTTEAQRNFNEFQWEQEIRRDERRISCYFRELCCCLDLPGEEEIIYDHLMSRSDLVPDGITAQNFRSWFDHEDEADEDEENRPRRPGSELVDQLDRLSTEWNALSAGQLSGEHYFEGIGVTGALAKLLARVADWSDVDRSELPALRRSLGKRAMLDLNDAAGRLMRLAGRERQLRGAIVSLIEELKGIRERIIDGC